MPNNTTTLQNLVDRTRQRADMEGSTFVSDTEVIGYINVAMAEIHDILVDRYEDYYVSSQQFTLPTDNPGTLPNTFYKALGVDFNTGGTTYRLRRFSFQERNVYNSPALVAGRVTNTLYAIQGAEIKFIPSPTVSGTASLFFVPEAQQFATSGSGFMDATVVTKPPAVAFGYEEYVVVDAAIKCLQKEESDVQMLMVQKQQLKERIENAASNRDQGEPTAITDSRAGTFSLRRGM